MMDVFSMRCERDVFFGRSHPHPPSAQFLFSTRLPSLGHE